MIPERWSYHPVSPKIPRWRAPSPPPFTKQKFLHQAAAPSLRKGRKICGSRSSDRSKREASLLVREVLRRATFKNTPRRPRLALLSSAVSRRSFLSLSTTQALSHPPRSLTPHIHARARAHAHIHIYLSLRPLAAAQNPTRSTAAEHTLSRSCSWQCDLVGSWTDPLMRDRRLTSWTTDTILVLTCTHDQNTVNWLKSRRELIITHRVKGWEIDIWGESEWVSEREGEREREIQRWRERRVSPWTRRERYRV